MNSILTELSKHRLVSYVIYYVYKILHVLVIQLNRSLLLTAGLQDDSLSAVLVPALIPCSRHGVSTQLSLRHNEHFNSLLAGFKRDTSPGNRDSSHSWCESFVYLGSACTGSSQLELCVTTGMQCCERTSTEAQICSSGAARAQLRSTDNPGLHYLLPLIFFFFYSVTSVTLGEFNFSLKCSSVSKRRKSC